MDKLSRRDFLKFFGLGSARTTLFEGANAVPAMAGTPNNRPAFDSGPLKIKIAKETATVCTSCSCGCGLIVYSEGDKVINIESDPDSPNNEISTCCEGITPGDANIIVEAN